MLAELKHCSGFVIISKAFLFISIADLFHFRQFYLLFKNFYTRISHPSLINYFQVSKVDFPLKFYPC